MQGYDPRQGMEQPVERPTARPQAWNERQRATGRNPLAELLMLLGHGLLGGVKSPMPNAPDQNTADIISGRRRQIDAEIDKASGL